MNKKSSTRNRAEKALAGIRPRITCPHCWHEFPAADTLWVATHPALHGDARLGDDAQRRFLPTRFDPGGNAIDSKGSVCSEVACPRCHLTIPRAMFEMPSVFFSILGSPGSGKSHLLATTTWQLRNELGNEFKLSITDADPESNQLLSRAEQQLFFNESPHELASLPKTETEGELYQPVQFGEQTLWYPRPFVFSVQPLQNHPRARDSSKISRAICLYDNAGEHFMPGGRSSISPATQHLTVSSGLIFLFDPTQHVKFREACKGWTNDPQWDAAGWSHRQDQVLMEAANRIRTQAGLAQNEKYRRPLVIAMTKFDAWQSLLENDFESRADGCGQPIEKTSMGDTPAALNQARVSEISKAMRRLMMQYAPEFVNGAEGFADRVTYIPVSSLGNSPSLDDRTGRLGICPADIAPLWAEIPLLYLMSLTCPEMIPSLPRQSGRHSAGRSREV